jgi:O-antigen/teichoic acid export membrane protein
VSTLKRNIFSNLAGGACRRTGPLLKVSALSAVIYILLLCGLIVKWGIVGAAAAYMGLGCFTLGAGGSFRYYPHNSPY